MIHNLPEAKYGRNSNFLTLVKLFLHQLDQKSGNCSFIVQEFNIINKNLY